MRTLLVMALFAIGASWSDLARQYPPGKEPVLVSGTAAANAAGSGVPQPAGKELAHAGNRDLGHNWGDLSR